MLWSVTACGSWLSTFAVLVPGIKFRSSIFVTKVGSKCLSSLSHLSSPVSIAWSLDQYSEAQRKELTVSVFGSP